MRYFSYDPNGGGFTFHETEAEARKASEKALEAERDLAHRGWLGDAESICWGKVIGRVVETECHAKTEDECHSCDETAEYELVEEDTEPTEGGK